MILAERLATGSELRGGDGSGARRRGGGVAEEEKDGLPIKFLARKEKTAAGARAEFSTLANLLHTFL